MNNADLANLLATLLDMSVCAWVLRLFVRRVSLFVILCFPGFTCRPLTQFSLAFQLQSIWHIWLAMLTHSTRLETALALPKLTVKLADKLDK